MTKSAPIKPHLRVILNLLYPQGIPQKLPVRFLKWLISYGRFIVVIVEIVVLVSFALRFKFDADLADLKEKINSQVPFLESLVLDEALIKQTQLRLASIRSTYTFAPMWSKTLTELSSQMPTGIKLTSLNLERAPQDSGLTFKVGAQTPSNNDVAVFLTSLKRSQFFKDINLASVSFDQGVIVFTIIGTAKGI